MEFSQKKNYYAPGIETLFGEHALRLNITIEKESISTMSKYMKMVVIVPRIISI